MSAERYPDYPKTVDAALDLIRTEDIATLKEITTELENLRAQADDTTSSVESKATAVLTAAALLSGILGATMGLVVPQLSGFGLPFWVALAAYVAVVFLLVYTAYTSMDVLKVGIMPSVGPLDIAQAESDANLLRNLAAQLLVVRGRTMSQNRRKVETLIRSQTLLVFATLGVAVTTAVGLILWAFASSDTDSADPPQSLLREIWDLIAELLQALVSS